MSIKKAIKKAVKKVSAKRKLKKAVKEMKQSAVLPEARAIIPNTQTKKQFSILNATEMYRKSRGIKTTTSLEKVDGKVVRATEAYMPKDEELKK